MIHLLPIRGIVQMASLYLYVILEECVLVRYFSVRLLMIIVHLRGETYYGFKGNVLINSESIFTGITLSQSHVDERNSLWDLVGGIHGMLIADKGLIGVDY